MAQPHKRLTIALFDRGDHFPVLASRLLQVAGISQAVESDSVGALGKLADRLHEVGVACLGEEKLVEGDVGVEDGAQISARDGPVMNGLRRLELLDVRLRQRHRDQGGGMAFQQVAQDVELLDLLFTIGAHHRAPVRHPLDDPHLLQVGERAPDHMTFGREAPHELVFDKAFPRMQPAKHNILLQ